MPKPRKQRLTELQRLHIIATTAEKIVDARDPKREFGQRDSVVGDCDVIAHRAAISFLHLTGFSVYDVRETELTNPSKRIAKALEERPV